MSVSFYRASVTSNVQKVKYSEFAQLLEDKKISEINITGTKLTGTLKGSEKDEQKKVVYTYAPYYLEIEHLRKSTSILR